LRRWGDAGCQKTENRRQMTDDKDQRSEVRGHMTDIGIRRSRNGQEGKEQKIEVRGVGG